MELHGSGKTMLARRLPTILPSLNFEEALEITKIHSVVGEIKSEEAIVLNRPFRAPHHNISVSALIGGGSIPKPGEISLAHYGVLFLDELPQYNRNTINLLRTSMEDKEVTISRVNSTVTYPSSFMLVASMNPCPCGYYGSENKECNCSINEINKYMGRISGPLLDRIDIQVEIQAVKYNKLEQEEVESSEIIRQRVNNARTIQNKRYKDENIFSNSELTPKLIEKYCKIDNDSKQLLKNVFNKLNLSARAYSKILKVARTIADLEGEEGIYKKHISEAIQYRNLDRKYL